MKIKLTPFLILLLLLCGCKTTKVFFPDSTKTYNINNQKSSFYLVVKDKREAKKNSKKLQKSIRQNINKAFKNVHIKKNKANRSYKSLNLKILKYKSIRAQYLFWIARVKYKINYLNKKGIEKEKIVYSKEKKFNWFSFITGNQALSQAYDKANKKLIYTLDDIVSGQLKMQTTVQQEENNKKEVLEEYKIESQKESKPKNVKKAIANVDTDIPINRPKKSNTYALIIGNQNYTKYQKSLTSEQNVPFAKRDARIFAKYCRRTIGIPTENIRLDTNVTKGQMQRHIDWLVKLSKYGGPKTKLIFYYSGHGFPDRETKKKYLMPVDIAGSDVTDGIHVSTLYDKLLKHDPKRATVFLDACFSGAGRGDKGLLAAKSVKVKPKENAIMDGNLVAFSSSQGDQRSWFYREKKHGLFTYFLLKKLQQTKGRVTYGALEAYLTKKVPIKSITTHNSEQVPQVNYSREIEGEWQDWRLR